MVYVKKRAIVSFAAARNVFQGEVKEIKAWWCNVVWSDFVKSGW